jgi:hypothetical protein
MSREKFDSSHFLIFTKYKNDIDYYYKSRIPFKFSAYFAKALKSHSSCHCSTGLSFSNRIGSHT